jgi:cytidine deaminase
MQRRERSSQGHTPSPSSAQDLGGSIALGKRVFMWQRCASGEILLGEKKDKRFQHMGAYALSSHDELMLASHVLGVCRPFALPDANGYYAASAVVARGGHMFVGVNNEAHIKDPYAGRGCGETSALRHAQEALHDRHVALDAVYLMSGVAKLDEKGALVDKEPGHVGCLCGECRDNLRDHCSKSTRFIMLPTGGLGETPLLNARAKQSRELAAGEAWQIAFDQMYPLPELVTVTAEGLSEALHLGYLYITDHTQPTRALQTPLTRQIAAGTPLTPEQMDALARAYSQADLSVPALQEEPSLANINRALLQHIRQTYAQHAHQVDASKPITITAVLLKGNDGKFYAGVSAVGEGWLPSKPPAFVNALSNAGNRSGFSEVYMMTFDSRQLLGDMSSACDRRDQHLVRMPTPGPLGRLIKNLESGDNPHITIIPVNDGTLTDDALQAISQRISVREAFGPGFSNPKKMIQGVH